MLENPRQVATPVRVLPVIRSIPLVPEAKNAPALRFHVPPDAEALRAFDWSCPASRLERR